MAYIKIYRIGDDKEYHHCSECGRVLKLHIDYDECPRPSCNLSFETKLKRRDYGYVFNGSFIR